MYKCNICGGETKSLLPPGLCLYCYNWYWIVRETGVALPIELVAEHSPKLLIDMIRTQQQDKVENSFDIWNKWERWNRMLG